MRKGIENIQTEKPHKLVKLNENCLETKKNGSKIKNTKWKQCLYLNEM